MNIILEWYKLDPLGAILPAVALLLVVGIVVVPQLIDLIWAHPVDHEHVETVLARIKAHVNNNTQTKVTIDENVYE